MMVPSGRPVDCESFERSKGGSEGRRERGRERRRRVGVSINNSNIIANNTPRNQFTHSVEFHVGERVNVKLDSYRKEKPGKVVNIRKKPRDNIDEYPPLPTSLLLYEVRLNAGIVVEARHRHLRRAPRIHADGAQFRNLDSKGAARRDHEQRARARRRKGRGDKKTRWELFRLGSWVLAVDRDVDPRTQTNIMVRDVRVAGKSAIVTSHDEMSIEIAAGKKCVYWVERRAEERRGKGREGKKK